MLRKSQGRLTLRRNLHTKMVWHTICKTPTPSGLSLTGSLVLFHINGDIPRTLSNITQSGTMISYIMAQTGIPTQFLTNMVLRPHTTDNPSTIVAIIALMGTHTSHAQVHLCLHTTHTRPNLI
jgi:hypothetical protein